MKDLDTSIRKNMPCRKRATLNCILRLGFVASFVLVASGLIGNPQLAAQARANLAALDGKVAGLLTSQR